MLQPTDWAVPRISLIVPVVRRKLISALTQEKKPVENSIETPSAVSHSLPLEVCSYRVQNGTAGS